MQRRLGESELERFEAWLVVRGRRERVLAWALGFAATAWYLGLLLASRGVGLRG